MTAQRKIVTTHITLNDEPAAQQALDELTLRFADDPKLSRELYEVGECYRKGKNYPSARALYDYIATEFPQTNDAMWSAQRQIVIDIDETEDSSDPAPKVPPPVLTKVENLIADFEGQPDLTKAVFFIGEEYYRNGHKGNFGPIKKDAKRYWPRAVKLWKKVIDPNMPFHNNYTPEAWFLTGVCYSRMNEPAAALPYLQKVLADWPDYKLAWDAQLFVGTCYEQIKRSGGAESNEDVDSAIEAAYMEALGRFADKKACRSWAHWRLAELKYSQQQWDAMAVHAAAFLENKPAFVDVRRAHLLYKLGMSYEKMGEIALARQTYQEHAWEFAEVNVATHKRVLARLETLEGGVQ